MVQLIELREHCQRVLNDASGTNFTDALVDGWIKEAIQEYSQYFRKVTYTVVMGVVSGTYNYSITADKFSEIIRVEYPIAQDPPVYLVRRDYGSEAFWKHGDSYDYQHIKGEEEGELFISDPTQGGLLTMHGRRSYNENATTIEVPNMHHPVLVARVKWQARQHQADGEMQDPTSNSSLLMAQMEQNAKSARRDYFSLLYAAIANESGKSRRGRWRMDKWD